MRTRDEFLSPATNVYPYLPRIVIASEAKKCEKKKKTPPAGPPHPSRGGDVWSGGFVARLRLRRNIILRESSILAADFYSIYCTGCACQYPTQCIDLPSRYLHKYRVRCDGVLCALVLNMSRLVHLWSGEIARSQHPNAVALVLSTSKYIMLLGSEGDVQMDLRRYAGSSMPRCAPALPCATRPPRHHDRATPAAHISPRCPWQQNCHRCPTRRAGGVEWRPPGDGSLAPRERGGFAGNEGFTNTSGAVFRPGSPPH